MDNKKSFIEHGGDIYTEGRLKGIELLDFSSNINFLGVPDSFKNNIYKALEDMTCYPDLKYRETKLHIREYLKYGINEENIILGNGAAEIIKLSISTLKKPCIAAPSFSEYEAAAKNYSKEVVFTNLDENFNYNYRDILDKLRECDGLVIANPNNPNGGIIDRDTFKEIMDYCEENKKRIIIDEAFIEFVNGDNQSLIDKCIGYKCLFIIRALTKFFGMPGVRFGYGISSDRDFINRLSEGQIPWNINTFAETAVKSVLRDEEYINRSKAMLEKERIYFVKELSKFKFINRIYKSHANFLLIKLKEITGEELFSYCISRGVLIRRCSNFRGLDDSFIRLVIKNREDNNRLLEIFRHIM